MGLDHGKWNIVPIPSYSSYRVAIKLSILGNGLIYVVYHLSADARFARE